MPSRSNDEFGSLPPKGADDRFERLHAFTAHFYKKLTQQETECRKRRRGEDRHAEAHALVARWTKDLDLFQKTYVGACKYEWDRSRGGEGVCRVQ